MATLYTDFTAPTSGTTITTGNLSGDQFGGVTVGSGNTLVTDTTHTIHGPQSLKIQGGGTASCTASWIFGAGVASMAFRAYMFRTAAPSAAVTPFVFQSGAGVSAAGMKITTGGDIAICNHSLTVTATMGTACPTNAWCRIEGVFTFSATVGTATIFRYDTPDSLTATDSISATAQAFNGATADRLISGYEVAVTDGPVWWSSLALNNTGLLIGPSVQRAAPALVAA